MNRLSVMILTNNTSVKSSFNHVGDSVSKNLWDKLHTTVWIKLTNKIGERLFHHIRYRRELTK